jgi:DNA topoisomerase IB
VQATVVHLLETTLIRVGNDDYAKQNSSYGLTTLKNHHVAVDGNEVRFRFTGKSGKQWSLFSRFFAAVSIKRRNVQIDQKTALEGCLISSHTVRATRLLLRRTSRRLLWLAPPLWGPSSR